jgi:hypothetical protein
MKALFNMRMRKWVILGSNKLIIFSKHNICGKGYNCKFSSLFLNVSCVIELY